MVSCPLLTPPTFLWPLSEAFAAKGERYTDMSGAPRLYTLSKFGWFSRFFVLSVTAV